MKKVAVITNNKKLVEKMKNDHKILFVDGSSMEVLTKSRDLIHKGHKLLTHPLMGSIKPNQTPFKSVAISIENDDEVDMFSLDIIEQSILSTKKFLDMKPLRQWDEMVIEDFSLIDYDLIKNAIYK